jgi:hypothetical protein
VARRRSRDVLKKPESGLLAQKIHFFDAYVYDPVAHALDACRRVMR